MNTAFTPRTGVKKPPFFGFYTHITHSFAIVDAKKLCLSSPTFARFVPFDQSSVHQPPLSISNFSFSIFSFFFIFKKNFHPPLSLHPIFSGYTCMHSIHTINTQDRSENSLFFRFFTHKLLDFTLFDVQTSQFFPS